MKKLNERQQALYAFLESIGDTPMKQEEVAKCLPEYYGKYREGKYHDSRARKKMTNDIRAINESGVRKIVISDSRGIKLSNEQEFARYISAEFASIFRRLRRARIKAGKAEQNEQGILASEEEFVKAFVN